MFWNFRGYETKNCTVLRTPTYTIEAIFQLYKLWMGGGAYKVGALRNDEMLRPSNLRFRPGSRVRDFSLRLQLAKSIHPAHYFSNHNLIHSPEQIYRFYQLRIMTIRFKIQNPPSNRCCLSFSQNCIIGWVGNTLHFRCTYIKKTGSDRTETVTERAYRTDWVAAISN